VNLVLLCVCHLLKPSLLFQVLALISSIVRCLQHPYNSVRHMSSRVLGTFSTLCTSHVMEIVLDKLVPFLNNVNDTGAREGAIEAIYCIL
jgi:hypothetical protein